MSSILHSTHARNHDGIYSTADAPFPYVIASCIPLIGDIVNLVQMIKSQSVLDAYATPTQTQSKLTNLTNEIEIKAAITPPKTETEIEAFEKLIEERDQIQAKAEETRKGLDPQVTAFFNNRNLITKISLVRSILTLAIIIVVIALGLLTGPLIFPLIFVSTINVGIYVFSVYQIKNLKIQFENLKTSYSSVNSAFANQSQNYKVQLQSIRNKLTV